MSNLDINQIKADLIDSIVKGDYITLSKMLNTTQETARARFRRDKKDAILGMQLIVNQRNDLINSYQEEK